jgi:predicted transcriptional regulator of viral defense system
MESTQDAILELAGDRGLIRPLDLDAHGLPRVSLTRLVRQGRLARVGRGLYALPDRPASEYSVLAEVARRHPRTVVCLLSALCFHKLTTQAPFEVWLAIPNKARPPQLDCPPLRIVRFSAPGLTEGVEEHEIDGVPVRITGIARTVADCFKHRNKIGLDVALDALKEALKERGGARSGTGRRASLDEIWRYAQLDRVANVMRPYLEALV